ncbi:xanthine dehydrogenase 1-like [Carica papaya]|uniref:xanthine dehydrogenase 1-like n=1 Tax=Carica papaya TaxID=3649 RepID=UPI000B8CF7D1|nr:xanthine dehydrogenase 1-like [Carica papaya]
MYGSTCYNEIDGSTYTDKEIIFPPELLLRKLTPLNLNGSGGLKWYRPLQLAHLLELKAIYPEAKLLVGNTEVGIEMRLKRMHYQVLISVNHVPELNVLSVKDDGITIGAAVRLTELLNLFKKIVAEHAAHEKSACKAFIEQLKWFAGMQIRNVASVGGNICTASPISDLNPLWVASRAEFQIIDCKGNIRKVAAGDFFLGYRKVDLASGEILLSVFLPWTRPFEYVKEFKQAHRRDDDIAIVNAGMRVFLEEKGQNWVVSDASIVYGGVAPLSLSAIKTKEFLIGKNWNKGLLQDTLKVIQTDILLKEDAPGGMVEFRKSLTLSFFFKFFLWVSHQLDGTKSIKESIPSSHLSAVQSFHRPTVIGSQDYEIRKHGTSVGSPEVHLSSRLQSFISSIIFGIGCLQVIGVVVADTHESAKLAARKVHVEYEELPAVLSIKEAIAAKSFHPHTEKCFSKGDVDLCFSSGQCDKIIEGEVQIGGQEHFYLEPQSSLIWTMDGGNEVHMISSTQAPQKHQKYVSHALGLPMSKVVCKTKRIGGGFGGKETRSAFVAAVASVPSYLLNQPVKITLDRDTDMMITGHRHSFLGKYKVGFTNKGKVLSLDLEIYNNAGNSLDLSLAVLERAMFHSDNVYEIPNIKIVGRVCFTNFPSNTAFRGFGGPQGMLIAENWIQELLSS